MISTWETQMAGRPVAGESNRGESRGCRTDGLPNVSDAERILSGVIGGFLLSRLSLRSLPGAVTAVVGTGLLYRAWTGQCPLYEKLGNLHWDEERISRSATPRSAGDRWADKTSAPASATTYGSL